MKETLKYFKECLYLLGKDKKRIPFIIILIFFSSLIELAGISLIAPYISLALDSAHPSQGVVFDVIRFMGSDNILYNLSLIIFLVFLSKMLIGLFMNYKIIQLSEKKLINIRLLLMQNYQNQNYSSYLKKNSSYYINNIQNSSLIFSFDVLLNFFRVFTDGLVGLVIIVFLAWKNWFALCLLIVLLGSVIWLFDYSFKNSMKIHGRLVNASSKDIIKHISEAIRGMKEIKILRKQDYFYDLFHQDINTFSYHHSRMHAVSMAPRFLLEFSIIFFVILLIVGMQFFSQDFKHLMPTLGMFAVASFRILPFANTLSTSLSQMRYARHAVSLLYEDLKKSNDNLQTSKKRPNYSKKEAFKTIKMNNVSFSYSGSNKNTLKNISIEICSGDFIGLVGTSGSGKTTLVDILLGLLEIDKGNILYNGKPLIEHTDLWHAQVAYLPQEVFLTDDTLRRNVALGIKDAEIDEVLVWQCIKKSQLSELLTSLPEGLETHLGERGIRLSGGQRQRVALARAFYHKREVLILDEATSALDHETEKEIIKEVQELKGQKTMIVIAHRMTTVQHCDRVYRLEDGSIISS